MRIIRLETGMGGKSLHAALDRLDAVAVKDGMVGSMEEFALADHLAKRAFDNKTNIARAYRYEFLLWLSGRRDIKSAMKDTEPPASEGKERFLVVVFSESSEKEIASALDARVVKKNLAPKAEPLALEKISLSRVKN
jgi:tRNA threonylcarbamoyladenosine modification (KEOPS) complex Cgi121 subunit